MQLIIYILYIYYYASSPTNRNRVSKIRNGKELSRRGQTRSVRNTLQRCIIERYSHRSRCIISSRTVRGGASALAPINRHRRCIIIKQKIFFARGAHEQRQRPKETGARAHAHASIIYGPSVDWRPRTRPGWFIQRGRVSARARRTHTAGVGSASVPVPLIKLYPLVFVRARACVIGRRRGWGANTPVHRGGIARRQGTLHDGFRPIPFDVCLQEIY